MSAGLMGDVLVAGGVTCAAVAAGAGLGYGAGTALDGATGGGWGRGWGETLGLIAPENNSDVVTVRVEKKNGQWDTFKLRTGDDDCDWELEQNSKICRKFRNLRKKELCWRRTHEIYSECLKTK